MKHDSELTESTRTEDLTPHGETILAREYNALVAHPHPSQNRRLVATRGVNRVLLFSSTNDDGVERYECDTCGYIAANGASVVSHMPTHNGYKKESDYDPKVLKRIIQIAAEERQVSRKGYPERTIARLKQEGINPLMSEQWNPTMVSRLYSRWHADDRYKPRVRRTVARPVTPIQATVFAAENAMAHLSRALQVQPPSLEARFRQLSIDMARVAATMKNLCDEVAKLPVDPAQLKMLKDKAEKYDTLRSMMGK